MNPHPAHTQIASVEKIYKQKSNCSDAIETGNHRMILKLKQRFVSTIVSNASPRAEEPTGMTDQTSVKKDAVLQIQNSFVCIVVESI